MALKRLTIENIRNLRSIEIYPNARLNLIYGNNGAGKTSILEAIHILGSGKSFRSSKSSDVRTHNSEIMRVTAQCVALNNNEHQLGWERDQYSRKIHIDAKSNHSISELAKFVPVRAIQPDTHYRFRTQNKFRRSMLDWGVFHVKPLFQEIWQRYTRVLQQRNEYLKQGSVQESVLSSWDVQICDFAEDIAQARNEYTDDWVPQIKSVYEQIFVDSPTDIDIIFQKGWETEQLSQQLKNDRGKDIKKASTHSGCHRADMLITIDQQTMGSTASQGQQKVLVLAMMLAQIEILLAEPSRTAQPILLLDDVPSELDEVHRTRLMAYLSRLPLQVFITTTDVDQVDVSMWSDCAMFHVEHGKIRTRDTVT
jgi:DNA replication and repair protein RecF